MVDVIGQGSFGERTRDADARGPGSEPESCLCELDRLHRVDGSEPADERVVAAVRLRHLAFAPRGRPAVRSADRDAAPGSSEPTRVVHAAQLTGAMIRAALDAHGSLLVRRLVSPAWAARLANDLDRAMADRAAGRESAHHRAFEPTSDRRWWAPLVARDWLREVGGMLTVDSPRAIFDYAQMLRSTGVEVVLGEYFGERPGILVAQSTMRRVTPGVGVPDWHQDGSFVGQPNLLNVWLALSDCGADAPALEVLPRRVAEILPTGTAGASASWTIAPDVVAEATGDAGTWRPRFQPGDALLFDERCVHRVHDAPGMTATRRSMETWFFAPSEHAGREIPMML